MNWWIILAFGIGVILGATVGMLYGSAAVAKVRAEKAELEAELNRWRNDAASIIATAKGGFNAKG